MPDLTQINFDELNCPACDNQALLEPYAMCSDIVADGVTLECPDCGFTVSGAIPAQVEAAVRVLWDYMPEPETFCEDQL